MASTAPAQPNPAQQQNGNRSPHTNGGHGDQQFKKDRNPPHKKDWAAKRDKDGSFNGNQQDPRGERPRRHRDENEANGSPSEGRREYREKRGGKGRARDAQNTNGTAQTNGNHVKPEASSSHIEEAKGASNPPAHIDPTAEQVLVEELHDKYPQTPVDKIVGVIRKHSYNHEKSLHELEAMQKNINSPWIDVVKKTPVQAKSTPVPHENGGRREKKEHDQQQGSQHQQQHQQQHSRRQPQQPYQHPHQGYPQQHQEQNLQQQQHQQQHQAQYQQPQNYPHYHQHYQQVHQIQPEQFTHEQQIALQPYPQAPQEAKEDMLTSLSSIIDRELTEVRKKTEMLSSLRNQLDLINNADKDHRSQLEDKRAQLEADRASFIEQLRNCENELATVKHLIKNAEDDKRHKIEDLYRSFQTNGMLAITSS